MKNTTLILVLISAVLLLAFKSTPTAIYTVDNASSIVKWTGYHLAKSYEHNGTIQIKSGNLNINNGAITGGEIVIDMNTLSNTDLSGKKNTKLVNHLKSDDFFGAEKYPEAKIAIKGSMDGKVMADLTIKGITKAIEFDATIKENSDGKVVVSATITVKRTDYKVMYGWSVENAMLSEDFKLDVEITATK